MNEDEGDIRHGQNRDRVLQQFLEEDIVQEGNYALGTYGIDCVQVHFANIVAGWLLPMQLSHDSYPLMVFLL